MALGIVTWLADNQENALTWFGSLTAPWVLVSFALGAIADERRKALFTGAGALLTGVVIYYLGMRIVEDGVNLSYFLSITAFWLLLAPAAGGSFGLMAWEWRNRSYHWLVRVASVAVPGGVIAGESAFMALTAASLSSGELTLLSGLITLGLIMPLGLLRARRERLVGLGMTLGFLALGMAMVPLIRWIIAGFETGPGLL